ncbi:hypothetical protein [Succinimonas sp.]|uniref:hypothetical protein n=1 Tax=Succinimonas sp. TaxID=1936151 RepID=UPI003867AB5F
MRFRLSSKTSLKEIPEQPDERESQAITDEYAEPARDALPGRMRRVLAKYARAELRELEEGAWERAAAEKHGRALKSQENC